MGWCGRPNLNRRRSFIFGVDLCVRTSLSKHAKKPKVQALHCASHYDNTELDRAPGSV